MLDSERDVAGLVRGGYDRLARDYTAWREEDPELFRAELQDLAERLPAGGKVLDVGCGAGVPFTLWLSERFEVTGVDFSAHQIELARHRVPRAKFLLQDMVCLNVPPHSFDAATCFCSLIHVPRRQQARVLGNFHRLLKPGGWLMLITGNQDLPDDLGEFLGQPMYWSHFDRATSLQMVREAGFEIVWDKIVADRPSGSHVLVLAIST